MTSNVILVNRPDEWELAYERLLRHIQTTRVIGFDCEWVEITNWKRLYETHERSAGWQYGKHKLLIDKKTANAKSIKRSKIKEAPLPTKSTTDELSEGEIASDSDEDDEFAENSDGDGLDADDVIDAVRLSNTMRDRISLVQMAAHDGFTVLVRLVLFKQAPETLRALLEDVRIVKVGVNIFADCSRLYRDWGIMVSSWLDIRYLLKDLPDSKLIEPIRNGLKALGEVYCDKTKKHDESMSYSNWCSRELTRNQIQYASQDARIAVESYAALGKARINQSQLKDSSLAAYPQNADKASTDDLKILWNAIHSSCSMYLNCKFDQDRYMSQKMGGTGTSSKKKKQKNDIETSDSDLDMAVEKLNQTLSIDQNDQKGRRAFRFYNLTTKNPSFDPDDLKSVYLPNFFYDDVVEEENVEEKLAALCIQTGRKKYNLKFK